MSLSVDRPHPVEYLTKKVVTVLIDFKWRGNSEIPVAARLSIPGQEAAKTPVEIVEGRHWATKDQALAECQESAERWIDLSLR
ncbi:hypothetical protein [Pseudomonas sp. Root569]|uniref:hypothetical protein n=1 Tax=Pseudomonas sp. Root569 TaxID=1736566 RepID=UPI0012E3E670|nr:hypothetical protein [Pseudomonas sp. Root569]